MKKLVKSGFLFKQVQNDNERAFEKLFDVYWEQMFTKAKCILLDNDSAKDVVQKVWIDLWQKRKNLEIRNFEAYVSKAVRNNCLKHIRDNKLNTLQLQVIESLKLVVEPEIEKVHNVEAVQLKIEKSLQKLTPRCQQIFRLSRIEKTDNVEIATRLGISKRTVENQIAIALKSLKQDASTIT